jgi:hypothetical protein
MNFLRTIRLKVNDGYTQEEARSAPKFRKAIPKAMKLKTV